MDDQNIFDYIEGNLNTEELGRMESHFEQFPSAKAELALWQASKLWSPESIVFPTSKIIQKSWWQGIAGAKWLVGIAFLTITALLIYPRLKSPQPTATNSFDPIVTVKETDHQKDVDNLTSGLVEVVLINDEIKKGVPTKFSAENRPTTSGALPIDTSPLINETFSQTGILKEKAVLDLMTGLTLQIALRKQVGYQKPKALRVKVPKSTNKSTKSKLKWGEPHIQSGGF